MIDYLLIGHIAHDETPTAPKVGGTVSYAGATAAALGARVGIVTSIRRDDPVLALLPDTIAISNVYSEHSTVFINTYIGESRSERRQVMPSRAEVLNRSVVAAAITPSWSKPRVLHLAPLCDEVDPSVCTYFPNALHVATPQGWMRAWDEQGVIQSKPWALANRMLPMLDAVVFSEEDIARDEVLERNYAARAKLLVVTRGENGCTVYQHGARLADIPAPRVDVVDPTGAGDIFAAAFFWMIAQKVPVLEAAKGATFLASQSVTRVGIEGVPSSAHIE